MSVPRYESFDPNDPDGFQVEVFDYPPLPADDVRRLHELVESGNRLWAAIRALNGAGRRSVDDGPTPNGGAG